VQSLSSVATPWRLDRAAFHDPLFSLGAYEGGSHRITINLLASHSTTQTFERSHLSAIRALSCSVGKRNSRPAVTCFREIQVVILWVMASCGLVGEYHRFLGGGGNRVAHYSP
jgi:hypothetical protein